MDGGGGEGEGEGLALGAGGDAAVERVGQGL